MAQLTLELSFRVAFLTVLLPLASGACVDLDLGVGSGTIPDSDITASTEKSVNTPAKNGRLNYTSGPSWCAGTSDLNPYLQIDLQTPHIICAVSTQGNSQADQWVKNYSLQISTDGTTWTDYKEDGQVKFLRGNDDRNSEVKHVVYGVLTRYLQFLPQIHQGGVCMRTEVFGVKQNPTCEMEAIGLAFNGKIPESSFTATSFFNNLYEPHNGRLNASGRGWGPLPKDDPKDYLQIDLLFEYVICAVATQGSKESSEWTTKYKIYFSLNGTNFFTYKETGVEKVFTGNTDRNTIKKNSLLEFASAKFIRFWPTAYYGWKVLRVEVYGVLLTKVPSKPPTAFNLTASSSTSITASWQLPPIFARHGRDITGFKLFYREKWFARCFCFMNITSGSTLSRLVIGLEKYTEYEFQVLAYTSDGDGPKSPVEVERTQGDGCVQNDLGMEGRNIPGNRISASSSRTPAENGRLNYALGAPWCAETNDTSPYLQIDLQALHIICAVSTQGNSQADQWVKNYTLQISTDGITWMDYMEGGQVEFLRGNNDRNSEVKHVVYGVLTRYLRFLPQIHQGGVCMRTEVFGVEQKPRCSMQAIGVASSVTIPDSSFSASSEFNSVFAAKYGRLSGEKSWAPLGNDNANDSLQIDLLFEYVICAVATQGNPRAREWTTKYKLQLALEDTKFITYQENSTDKVFDGNSDRNTIVKNSLQEFASAKFIRFQPTAFSSYKGLRVEVYGILLTKVPIQPPTAFNLTANSSTSITASWQLPPIFTRHGRHITGFKIFYRKKDLAGCFSFLNITSGSTLSRLVTGLEKYTEYIFQVLAYTSKGDGLKSSVEAERTMEDAPSRPPSNFYVTATSSTSVTASWQLPPVDSRNGIIKGFKVFYKRKDSSGSGIILTINGESSFKKNVTGLNKYKEYEFKVLAFTSVEDGPYTSVVVQRTNEDVPSQPPGNFTLTASTSTSITASWQLPPQDFRNGNITGYKLFYKKGGSSGPASMQPVDNQATRTQEVTELDKFTEYEFQILAFTSVGDGPNSTVIFEKTKEAAPSGPPSQFNVTVNSSTSITASWHLPPESFRHGIIRGYKLFYKKKESGSTASLTINDATSKRVTNLDEYTEYEFQVLAFTSAGEGPNSSTVFTTTMEDVPSRPPSNLYVTATSSTTVTVSWQLPPVDSRNGIIKGFKVFYKRKDSSGSGTILSINGESILNKNITGLSKYTEYEFKVLAFTSVGDGPNSSVVVEKTGEDAPSGPPSQFNVTVNSSTSITASWHLPPESHRHGIIRGYKLYYKKKDSGSITSLTINNATSKRVTNLDEYIEYEFQVSAFTSAGDGPKSSTVFTTTMEDAPSAPTHLSFVDVPPSNLHGPRANLSWSKPAEPNGVIRSYTLFYSHGGGVPKENSGLDKDALSHTVDVLGGVTYQFHVRAVTIKPGPNGTINVTTKEYAPSVGPEPASTSQVNKTTFNISWEPLPRGKSYGKVTLYEVKAIFLKKENSRKRSVINSLSANTSATFVVLSDFELCSKYNVSVRAYTAAGSGPYGEPLELKTSKPEPPGDFKATHSGTTQVTLTWTQYDEKGKIDYTVKYTGTKDYDKTFKDGEKIIESIQTLTQTVTGLNPGTKYVFEVYGISVCGKSISKTLSVETDMIAPEAPVPLNVTDVEISETAADILLWPVEQKFGPISAYQVIVLKVVDGVEKLLENYDSQLKAAGDAKKDDVNFYIAAEIKNVPVLEKPWKFTVGDGKETEIYVNEELEKGQNYIVYERALTDTTKVILEGKASKVAKITISPAEEKIRD